MTLNSPEFQQSISCLTSVRCGDEVWGIATLLRSLVEC
jgi:hypothetical protein